MEDHAVVIADPTGAIQFWSAGAERLFGHRAADVVGQTLDLIVPEQYRETHWNGFRHAMASGTAKAEGQPIELPVNCKAGVVVFPATFRLLRDRENAVIGAMLVCNPPKAS